ncbi:universal stress protein [Streptomyces sp. NPDC058691]|uniref:universal stress protein n=1 Tax=Streptomyces sp. NPDC058691 TaxID=3346601 RepID=UPI0036589416
MAGHGSPEPFGDSPYSRSSTAGEPAFGFESVHTTVDKYGVLVGYSGSAPSRRALSYAAGMARRTGAALIIVHVARQNAVASFFGFEPPLVAPGRYGGTHALMSQLAHEAHLSGLHWILVRRSGVVADELERAGRRYRANVIIVGRSRGAGGRLFRSISHRLARRAQQPVIVVP